MKRLMALALISLSVMGAPIKAAYASHYRLPVVALVEEPEAALLAKAGVKTTLDLLEELSTAAKRKKLSKNSGLPLERLEFLAYQMDLLRIDGLGPSMVRLFQASGVKHTVALAQETPSGLKAKLQAANAGEKFSPVLPSEPLLQAWIAQAKALPAVVRDLPL